MAANLDKKPAATAETMSDSEVRRALAELGIPAPDKITAIERWVLSLPDDFPGANPSETPPQKTAPRTRAVARPVDRGMRRR